MIYKLVFTLSILFVFAQLQAQNNLDSVTVTATLTPTPLNKTGRNVTIIKGELFSKLPVNSLDELLRYIPGVDMQMRGAQGAQSDITLRGGTFNQVLVVLDGIRLNDPLTGHFSSYIPIAPNEIDRIEVLKGAASSIYGTEAVGGVIHIITKSFVQHKSPHKFTAQATAGKYNLMNVQAGLSLSNKNNFFNAGLMSNHTNGYKVRGAHAFADLSTFSASFSSKLNSQITLSLRSSYDNRSFNAQNYYTSFVSDTAIEKVKSSWNQAQLKYAKNNSTITINAGFKHTSDYYLFSPKSTANQNKTNIVQTLITWVQKLNNKSTITSGLQYLTKKVKSNDRGNHQVTQLALFTSLLHKVSDKFTINPAIRFDNNTQGGFEFVPQLNLSYTLNKLQFRTSFGRSLRDADFSERYNNYNKPLVINGSLGNPNLKSESSNNYEIGIDYQPLANFKVSATYFYRNQKNVIDWAPTPYAQMPRQINLVPTGNYFLAKNVASVNGGGFETDFIFQKDFDKKSNLYTSLGLIWMKNKKGTTTPAYYLDNYSKFLANFNTIYNTSKFTIALNGLYKNRNQKLSTPLNAIVTAHYFLLNTKAEVKWFNQKLGTFVQIDNATDISYSDILGAIMPKRWCMVGVKVAL